ncbi:MAG TPA: DUF1800 domain-containing protein [Candidatus Acidoferrum sp.]|jgi:uncharacterized protein (DUF1800 family)|nr:DUF1800 domain-containing protein [Candidatus Acidoferrum sp.]
MRLGRTKFAALLLCFSLACTAPQLLAKKKGKAASGPSDPRRALHALNRLTFGPRPGDLQQVMAMGVDQWIDLQLHPGKIDDSALSARLEPLRTVHMSTKEIVEEFPDPQEIRQVMEGKRSMPSDPGRRAVYQVQVARLQDRKGVKEEAGKNRIGGVAAEKSSNPPRDGAAMAANTAPDASGTVADNPAMNGGMSDAMNSGAGSDATMTPAPPAKLTPEEEEQARRREEELYADLEVQQLPNLSPDQRFKKVLGMSTAQQVAFADSLRGGKGQEFLEGLSPKQKETLLAMNNPAIPVMSELMQAKLLRAIYSQRQFEEVMTDFWFNHFNVFMEKGLDRVLVTSYERDVIRPRALGRFEDLLVATAKSPAMLFYLDNFMSVGPNSAQALGLPARPYGRGPYGQRYPPARPRPNASKRPSGLNENYGRELLELHTLSVNGGYSQRDVTEVAKVFTGWTIDKPAEGGGFKFDPRMHEPGPKFVLGHKIKPKGEGEGLEVLHRLATSPQTAHFISLKLAQRFVSDDPPVALVDRMTKTFLSKKGDIREVLGTLFHSPEFWDDGTYRAKVKTPLEFVASAVRATGAEVADAFQLAQQLNRMGMPLYGAQPPTGYSMKAETWVSSSALLNRMNFALALTSGKIKGVKVEVAQLGKGSAGPSNTDGVLSTLEASLIAGGVSKQTHDSIAARVEGAGKNGAEQKPDSKAGPRKPEDAARPPDASTIAGLLLGSPEFQRR